MARPETYGTLEQVLEIYAGVWGAGADAEGADYWVGAIAAGNLSFIDTAASFFDQPLVQELYQDAEGNALTGDDLLAALYVNIFKVAAADAEGIAYWQGRMADLGITDYDSANIGTLVMEMIDGMWANAAAAAAQQLYMNWIAAAVAFYDYQVAEDLTPYSSLSPEEQADFLYWARYLMDHIPEICSSAGCIAAAVNNATNAIDPNGTPHYTLEQFLALDTPPVEYNLSDVAWDVGAVDVASAEGTYPLVEDAVAGALNGATLALTNLFAWSIADTAENIANAAEDLAAGETANPVIAGAAAIRLTAESSASIADAEAVLALVNFTGTYVLADTLANLTNAQAGLVEGAESYSLTDPAGDLGRIAAAQVAIVEGAANAADYTWPLPCCGIFLTAANDIVGLTAEPPFQTTNNDDMIFAELAVAESTLNAGDQIDGGAGEDTLDVVMNGNFNGFGGAGFLRNVEIVSIYNASGIPRTFDATGVADVGTYNLDATGGAINLSALADTDADVDLSNQASGNMTIGFAAGAVSGTGDILAIGVMDVGTPASGGVESAVTVTASGIERLAIEASGDNIVALDADDAREIGVGGSGDLKLTDVGAAVTIFDGASAEGTLFVDLTSVSGMTSILGGAGDDTFRFAVAGDGESPIDFGALAATVTGGAGGIDSMIFTHASAIDFTSATVTGIEALRVAAADGARIAIDTGFFDSGAAATAATLTLTDAADGDAHVLTIAAASHWDAQAATNAAAVAAAGDWFLDAADGNGVLTYYDESGETVVTLALTGFDAGGVSVADGILTWTA